LPPGAARAPCGPVAIDVRRRESAVKIGSCDGVGQRDA
jgi:hypothetical protein